MSRLLSRASEQGRILPSKQANSCSKCSFKTLDFVDAHPTLIKLKISWNHEMRNNFRDDQSTGSIETSGFSDDDENEDQYDQEEESAPMAPIQGWDVFEVGCFIV